MKKTIFLLLSLVIVIITVWLAKIDEVKSSENNSDLVLTVITDKQSYILGEEIKLNFEIKDKNNKPLTLRSVPTVEVGYMHVWIASSNRNFKEYEGRGWGLFEVSKLIQKETVVNSQATVLFNSKPPDGSFTKDRIKTDYAITEVGTYYIKATANILDEINKSDDDKKIIESEPIQILVNEPEGEDAEVWSLIKDKGDFALFMQQGDFLASKIEEREKLIKEVERIAVKYPNSILANQMKRHIEEFRQLEEEIKENIRKKQNN